MVAVLEPTRKSLQQLFDLNGKSAVVTGGALGIGFGIARRLAEAGAYVTIADVNVEAAMTSAHSLIGKGWTAQAIQVDVRSASDIQRSLEKVVAVRGGLDIWVNNAGVYPVSPILELSEEMWDRVLGVNLKGTFLGSQAAARQMVKQGRGGVIINIASIDAVHPSFAGLGAYDASKGGMLMFTRSLALELGPHNIRVMAIAPGGINTEGTRGAPSPTEGSNAHEPSAATSAAATAMLARVPLGRMGEPDDIARVALFLASDAAAYMTGSVVFVDGGYLLT
jgi:NAD(P)-dependent dehydrogenase (short-subunit alcohol dehydrogenase family)